MRRLSLVRINWNANFAYAIGLLATDGSLSKDGRHLNLTSKEREMIVTFKKHIGIKNKIGKKARGGESVKKYFQVQFGDKNFYHFLLSIGFTPAKSKTLSELEIPPTYFKDFFRGCVDGDGNIHTFVHPKSRKLQLRLRIISASLPFLVWLKGRVSDNFDIQSGWIDRSTRSFVLSFGKGDAIKIFKLIYYSGVQAFLARKYDIAKQFMRV